MYLMFFLVAAGGLMSAAQLAPIVHERGIADLPITLFGVSTTAIVAALTNTQHHQWRRPLAALLGIFVLRPMINARLHHPADAAGDTELQPTPSTRPIERPA
jgi:hypothetical protein